MRLSGHTKSLAAAGGAGPGGDMDRSYPEARIRAGNVGGPGAGFSKGGPHQPCTHRSHPTHPSTVFCRHSSFPNRIPTASHVSHPTRSDDHVRKYEAQQDGRSRSSRDGQRAPRPAVWVSTSRIFPPPSRAERPCARRFPWGCSCLQVH